MKILMIKASSLGDIVHSFPTLTYLKKKCPDAQIDWVVEKPFASLVTSHPEVHRAILCDTKKWRRKECLTEIIEFIKTLRSARYDLILDLQGNLKSWIFFRLARGINKQRLSLKKLQKGTSIREDYLSVAKEYFKNIEPFEDPGVVLTCTEDVHTHLKKSPNIIVCPGAAWPNKQLSKKTLIEVLQNEKGTLHFLWGNESEKTHAQKLQKHFPDRGHILPKLSIPALQKLMSQADLVIAMDSFPLHLAATTNTPTLSFFGPSSAKKYAPQGKKHRFIQGKCPYGVHFEFRCPKLRTCKTGACLKNL